MERVLEFLKAAKTFYLATLDGDQPRVRPYGAVMLWDGKLYICTNKTKPSYKQMEANPKVEICAMSEGKWIRIEAKAITDERTEAKAAMLESSPSLRRMYSLEDGIFRVLYLQDATATISSFSGDPVVIRF